MDDLLEGLQNTTATEQDARPAYVPAKYTPLNQETKSDDFASQMKDLMISSFQDVGKSNQLQGSALQFADRSQTDIYRNQKDFNSVGFNPSDSNNYDKFLSKETMGSALSKGFDSFSHKFGGTFKDYWKDYGRMADAVTSMDWSKMMPDEDEMLKQYYEDQIDSSKNFVFVEKGTEDDIFNKRFLSEFIGNAGFAMGTFSALSLEIAADILITGLTGGAGSVSLAATWARLTGKAAAKTAAKEGAEQALTKGFFVDDLFKGFASTSGKSVDEIAQGANAVKIQNATRPIAEATSSVKEELIATQFGIFSRLFDITKSKSAGEIAANFGRALPVVGAGFSYAEKIAAGAKAGISIGELTGIGLQGLRRMAQELNMSSTEASFEAVTSYGDTLNTMIDQHRSQYGEAPDATQIETMKSLALSAASGTYNTNMGILLSTNKLQFGNLFNKFAPANRVMRELTESTDGNFLTVGTKKLTQVFDKGKWGTVSTLGQVAKDFGKKEAAYQMGKSFMKNVGKFELSEGIQENMQEMSSAAWKNYYISKYNSTGFTVTEAFEMGLEEQFTKQGFKTFLMGALTGSIISGPTKAINMSLNSLREGVDNLSYQGDPAKRPSVLAKKRLQEDLALLNTSLRDISGANFKEKEFNFNVQMNAAMNMANAATQGKEYDFQNAKDDAFLGAVSVAKRTGSIKALQQALRNMGETMTEDEFKASFGIDLKETNYNSPREFAESIAKKVGEYSDTVDAVKKKVGPFIDPFIYEARSMDRLASQMLRSVQEDLVEVFALNKVRGGVTAERAKQVAQKFQEISSLADSSSFALRAMSDSDVLHGEIGLLIEEVMTAKQQEKEVLDPMVKQELKKEIKLKQEKIGALNKWLGFFGLNAQEKVEIKEGGIEESMTYSIGAFQGASKKVTSVTPEGLEKTEETFDQSDDSVKDTFRKIMEIHNGETGSKKIPDSDIQQAFDLFVDYMNLEKDTRDYMSAVEVFTDPAKMMEIYSRMYSGKIKYEILGYLNEVDVIAFKAREAVVKDYSEQGKDLLTVYEEANRVYKFIAEESRKLSSFLKLQSILNATDKEHNLSDWIYLQGQVEELRNELKKIVELSSNQVEVKKEEPAADDTSAGFISNTPEAQTETTEQKIKRLEDELASIQDDNDPRILEIDTELTALNELVVTESGPGNQPLTAVTPGEEVTTEPEVIVQSGPEQETQNSKVAPSVVTPDSKPSPKESSETEEILKDLGVMFPAGKNYQAFWNRKQKRWYFFNKKGKLVTRNDQIIRLAKVMSQKRGMINIWWNELLNDVSRADSQDIFDSYMSLVEAQESSGGMERALKLQYILMNAIKSVKFTPAQVEKNVTDVDIKKWTAEKRDGGYPLDSYVNEVLADVLRENGVVLDESEMIDLILEIINDNPKGITEKSVEEFSKENSYQYKMDQVAFDFAYRFGMDIETVMSQLQNELSRFLFNLPSNEKPETTGPIGSRDQFSGNTSVQESPGDLFGYQTSLPGTQTGTTEEGYGQDDKSKDLKSALALRKAKPEFSAEATSETTAVVVDEQSIPIGEETTLEKAEAQARILNLSLDNVEFSKKFLGEDFSSDERMLHAFIEAGNKAMKAKIAKLKTKPKYFNLEGFFKTAAGKKALSEIKAKLLGLDLKQVLKSVDGTGKAPVDTSFDVSSNTSKMSIGIDELKSLDAEVLQIIEKNRKALQNQEKNGKFVEETFFEKELREREAIEILELITKCTK